MEPEDITWLLAVFLGHTQGTVPYLEKVSSSFFLPQTGLTAKRRTLQGHTKGGDKARDADGASEHCLRRGEV